MIMFRGVTTLNGMAQFILYYIIEILKFVLNLYLDLCSLAKKNI